MATKSAQFTASGTWTAPAGVSAISLTMIGGGAGATTSGHSPCGGAGAAEMVMDRRIAVTPGATYTVTVGGKGVGATVRFVQPTLPTSSSFGNYIALGAGAYNNAGTASLSQAVVGGDGGGVGGGCGYAGGGTWDGAYGPAGIYHTPLREACQWHGGGSGGGGYPPYANPIHGIVDTVAGPDYRPGTGTGHGGTAALQGRFLNTIPGRDGNTYGGGGPGAATLWGYVTGGDGPATDSGSGNVTLSAGSTAYGAGAGGGSGMNAFCVTDSPGGDGGGGYVLLLWEG